MKKNIAYENMIARQLRTWDILDNKVLSAMSQIDRAVFIPKKYSSMSYADIRIPLNNQGAVILEPKAIGKLLQALELNEHLSVLEIGTGSGYLTSLLANLAKNVLSIEIDPQLSLSASRLLKSLNINNVEFAVKDGLEEGFKSKFDRIVITGGLHSIPQYFKDLLKDNGILFAFIGDSPVLAAVLYKKSKSNFETIKLFETDLPYLINAVPSESFIF